MKADFPTAVLAIVLVCLFAGTLLTYSLNPNDFGASAEKSGSEITVDMHATVQSDYIVCAVEMDNTERELSYFYDERYVYPRDYDGQRYDMDALSDQLKYTNVSHKEIDADALKAMFQDTGNAKKNAVVIFSGALPCNVYTYDGTSITVNDALDWLNAGGVIYWYSSEKFGYYSAPLKEDFSGDWETGQPLDTESGWTGIDYLAEADTEYATARSDISKLLNLTQNEVWEAAPLETSVTNIGYLNDDGRCSLSFRAYGTGRIVILGGEWTDSMTMAKIITSRVCEWNSLTDHASGTFKGTKEITFTGTANAAYVCFGTFVPRYAELFLLG